MKTLKNKIITSALAVCVLIAFSSCDATRNANNKQKGAVIGAASGAILGAIIGNNVGKGGNGEIGAVIGGVVGGGAGILIGNKMDKQAQKIENEIPGAVVERVDDGIVVTFDENSGVYFDTAKYNINSASQATLNKLAGVFAEYPDTNILVEGHTDNTGSESYNLTLSKNRAQAVTNFLTDHGIAASRFDTKWYGEAQPKYDNSTAEGRSKNRRVEIAIVANEDLKQEAEQKTSEN